jgi:hypothetical protein
VRTRSGDTALPFRRTTMKRIFFSSWLCFVSSAFQPSKFPISIPNNLPPATFLRHSSIRPETPNAPTNKENKTLRNSNYEKKSFPRKPRVDNNKLEWLNQATERFVSQTEPGTLIEGKWHEVVSLLNAWSSFQKDDGQAPVRMEALLKVLVEERRTGNTAVELTMDLYNKVLDAWACAAIFGTIGHPKTASQRAREILVMLQENYEHEKSSRRQQISDSGDNSYEALKPNAESFDVVLHAVGKAEDILTSRRLLAWMEYLHKSGKNVDAKPSRSDYIQILDAYAKTESPQAGVLAEAFLRHMKHQDVNLPDTLCYNIAIKAWSSQRRRGREAAEHADRILEEMKEEASEQCRPDVVTYGCKWLRTGYAFRSSSRFGIAK